MRDGIYTEIPTFFTADNSIDFNMLKQHLDTLRLIGYDKFVFLGTSSETLRLNEMKAIKDFVVKHKKPNDFYVFGVRGNGFWNVINNISTLGYDDNEIDSIMLSVPFFNNLNQYGLIQYFSRILNTYGNKQFMLCNDPNKAGVNVKPMTFKVLEEKFNNFVGIKESSGNINQITDLVGILDKVKVFSGNDKIALPGYSVGTAGVISGASNLTNDVKAIYTCFNSGYNTQALQINKKLNRLYDLLFVDCNPVPLKYILHKKYRTNNYYVRTPLVKLSSDVEQTLDRLSILSVNPEEKVV